MDSRRWFTFMSTPIGAYRFITHLGQAGPAIHKIDMIKHFSPGWPYSRQAYVVIWHGNGIAALRAIDQSFVKDTFEDSELQDGDPRQEWGRLSFDRNFRKTVLDAKTLTPDEVRLRGLWSANSRCVLEEGHPFTPGSRGVKARRDLDAAIDARMEDSPDWTKVYPSQAALAQSCGLDPQALQAARQELEAAGLYLFSQTPQGLKVTALPSDRAARNMKIWSETDVRQRGLPYTLDDFLPYPQAVLDAAAAWKVRHGERVA